MFGDLFSTKTDRQLGLLYTSRRKFLVSAGKNTLEPPRDFKTKQQARRSALLHGPQPGSGSDISSDSTAHSDSKGAVGAAGKRRESVFSKDLTSPTGQAAGRLSSLLAPMRRSIGEAAGGGGGEGTRSSQPLKAFKKTAKFIMEAVIIEHYWEGSKEDWQEEEKAGVRYFVNKKTAEVSADCPWRTRASLVKGSGGAITTSNGKMIRRSLLLRGAGGGGVQQQQQQEEEEGAEEGTGSLVYDKSEVDELFHLLDSLDHVNTTTTSSSSPPAKGSASNRQQQQAGSGGGGSGSGSPYRSTALNVLKS